MNFHAISLFYESWNMIYAKILKYLVVKVKKKRKQTDQSYGITHNSDFLVFDSYVVSCRVKIFLIR